ncbi:hypothetical protein Slit_1109 [Sideroxydans lithotrophicus ES-1]|uniref:Transmembrane protein n=2 Tax=Sideroxydans TaxID=314343 RepID=D5CQW1_SIDLE|nr:hypothetical protein Slit_1109 [Sideroxydans lithotrophicus ES-1]
MRNLSAKRIVVLIFCGVIAAWLWVWLLGLWAVYDTPLLKLGLLSGFTALSIGDISMALFALSTAGLFTALLCLWSRRSLLPSAVVSALAFSLVFLVPALLDTDGISFLSSFTALWLFVVFFGLCVLLASKLHNAARNGRTRVSSSLDV